MTQAKMRNDFRRRAIKAMDDRWLQFAADADGSAYPRDSWGALIDAVYPIVLEEIEARKLSGEEPQR